MLYLEIFEAGKFLYILGMLDQGDGVLDCDFIPAILGCG
jgi:hypothetical protein